MGWEYSVMIITYGADLRLHLPLDNGDMDDEDAVLDAVENDLYRPKEDGEEVWNRTGNGRYVELYDNKAAFNDDTRAPRMEEWSRKLTPEALYGDVLDDAGAHLVPTLLIIDDDALTDYVNPKETVSGDDYTLFKGHAPYSFKTKYDADALGSGAVEDFAENCAALDRTGMDIEDSDIVIENMVSDGSRTYLPLHRSYTGYSDPDPVNDHSEMREAGLAFIDGSDRRRFEQRYNEARSTTI